MTEDTGADWAHQQELEHQELLEEEERFRQYEDAMEHLEHRELDEDGQA